MAVNLEYFYPVVEWNKKTENEIRRDFKKEFGIDLNDYIGTNKTIFDSWDSIVKKKFGNQGILIYYDAIDELIDAVARDRVNPDLIYKASSRYDVYADDVWILLSSNIAFLDSKQIIGETVRDMGNDLSLEAVFPEIFSESYCKQLKIDFMKGKSSIPEIFDTSIWLDEEKRARYYSEWVDFRIENSKGNVTRWTWEKNYNVNVEMYKNCQCEEKINGAYVIEDLLVYSKLINSGLVRRCVSVADRSPEDAIRLLNEALQFRGKAWQTLWVESKKRIEDRIKFFSNSVWYFDSKSDKIIRDGVDGINVEKTTEGFKIDFSKVRPSEIDKYLTLEYKIDKLVETEKFGIGFINDRLALLTKGLLFLYENSCTKNDDKNQIEYKALEAIKNIDGLETDYGNLISQHMKEDLKQRSKQTRAKQSDNSRLYLQKKDTSLNAKYCYLQAYTIAYIQKLFTPFK